MKGSTEGKLGREGQGKKGRKEISYQVIKFS
jgi:hypothetical protein